MVDTAKKSAGSFAVLGGQPAFDRLLHVGRPNIGDRDRLRERIDGILDRRWLTNHGPLVRELEAEIAARVGVRHCVALCNGTIALEIAVRALGLGGEVIVPSFTFVATAHALQWQQITPVFCDIDPATHNIDPLAVERRITPRTTGIIGVHVWGRPCPVEALAEVAARHELRLLFDAAHAFGCSHGGRTIGALGFPEVFSFHATKIVNAFEGGAVVTDDDGLARRIRLMANFGFVDRDRVISPGINGKMTEVSAAMCLTSLESHDAFVAANRQNHETYRSELADLRGISLIRYDESEGANFQYVVLEVDPAVCPLDRDQLVELLTAENVLARRYFWPGCHRMEPYRSVDPDAGLLLPHTEEVAARVLLLPTGTDIEPREVRGICRLIRRALELAPELRSRLAATGQWYPLETGEVEVRT